MNTNNFHHTYERRYQTQPNMSAQINLHETANNDVTMDVYNSRYMAGVSSKLNIFDNTRTVEPQLCFGVRHIDFIDPTQRWHPAGMLGQNITEATGKAFTKPVRKHWAENSTFIRGL